MCHPAITGFSLSYNVLRVALWYAWLPCFHVLSCVTLDYMLLWIAQCYHVLPALPYVTLGNNESHLVTRYS